MSRLWFSSCVWHCNIYYKQKHQFLIVAWFCWLNCAFDPGVNGCCSLCWCQGSKKNKNSRGNWFIAILGNSAGNPGYLLFICFQVLISLYELQSLTKHVPRYILKLTCQRCACVVSKEARTPNIIPCSALQVQQEAESVQEMWSLKVSSGPAWFSGRHTDCSWREDCTVKDVRQTHWQQERHKSICCKKAPWA